MSSPTAQQPVTRVEDPSPVDRLIAAAADADGVAPLSDRFLRGLHGGAASPRQHWLLERDGAVVGYAQRDDTEPAGAELVVDPSVRGTGLGETLLSAVLAAPGPLGVWAHGDLPTARALAERHRLVRTRGLHVMSRGLGPGSPDLPEPVLPPGVTVRTFSPGIDDDEWLAVNARTFVDLPDQGGMTLAELHERVAEPWFDPAGFFLAIDVGGAIQGFHWTKVHDEPGGRVGEVYAVGSDPSQRGTGLGRALTLVGLQHLRDAGLPRVLLYVDDSNGTAVRLYEDLGFGVDLTDAEYSRTA